MRSEPAARARRAARESPALRADDSFAPWSGRTAFYALRRGEGCGLCAEGRPGGDAGGARVFAGRSPTHISARRTSSAATRSSSGAAATSPSRRSSTPDEAAAYWLEVVRVGAGARAAPASGEDELRGARELGSASAHPRRAPVRRRPEAGLAVPLPGATSGRRRTSRPFVRRRGAPGAARLRRAAVALKLSSDEHPLVGHVQDRLAGGAFGGSPHRHRSAWFRDRPFDAPTPRPGARLAGDRERRAHADPGADRLGQDARRLPLRDRPARRRAGRGPAPALRLAAEGAELRRRAQPARAARRARVASSRVAVRTGDTPQKERARCCASRRTS